MRLTPKKDSLTRTRIDSDNFPSLPTKVIEINLPTGPLEEMDLESDEMEIKLKKKDIIQKFQEFKEQGKIQISKKLKYLSNDKFPIIHKEGDVRLEELEPTPPQQLNVIISEKGSKNVSRKVSHMTGDSNGNN